MLKPLVILGGLTREEAQKVLPIVKAWGRPVYAEALSQLRGDSELSDLEIRGGEDSVKRLSIDGVIRVGQVPTLRFWRDLESMNIPVLHFCDRPFPGLSREKTVYPLASVMNQTASFSPWSAEERLADQTRAEQIQHLLKEFPQSECAFVNRVSEWIPKTTRVFLGNSLPIREWDFAASRETDFTFYANRGVNGIDGLVSTVLGLSEPGVPVAGVIGDLSALYDLSGLWAAREWTDRDITLFVINNGGGKIFERIFRNPLFENNHNLEFSSWAKMWNWSYQKIETADESPAVNQGRRIIEIVPNPEHTAAFHKACEAHLC